MDSFDNEELYQLSLDMLESNDNSEITLIKTAEAFEMLGDYKNSQQLALECRERAEKIKKDEIYKNGIEKMQDDDISSYEDAILFFMQIPDWKDSSNRISECNKAIEKIKINNEKKQLEEKQKQIATKKKRNRIAIITAPIVAGIIVFVIVIISI